MVSIDTALVFACRYCHNRPTGGALAMVELVLVLWDELPEKTKETIVREAEIEAVYNKEDWQMFIDRYERAKCNT